MKVIVTRPRAQAQPLVGRIEELGHEVVECPLIEIIRTSDEPIDCAGYEWAVVTSPNGADEVARRARNLPKVAAVGPGTAETLRGHGIEPAFVASRLDGRAHGRRVPRARGQGDLPRGRELPPRPDRRARGRLRAALQHACSSTPEPPEGDVVVLASGSAARAYAFVGGSAPAVSIGPETTRVADSVGIEVVGEAKTHDLDGLVAAVAEYAAALVSTTSRS